MGGRLLLYVDLAKAQELNWPPVGGSPHKEPVHVAAHTRHTSHGEVQVPAHTRLVLKMPDPEHVAGAREAFDRMNAHDDADWEHASRGLRINHPLRVAIRSAFDKAQSAFYAYPQQVTTPILQEDTARRNARRAGRRGVDSGSV